MLTLLALLTIVPTIASAQSADKKSSPFEALRWNGDSPEIMVQDTWYRPVTLDGIEIKSIVAYCKQKNESPDLLHTVHEALLPVSLLRGCNRRWPFMNHTELETQPLFNS
ncbi:MAG: hypothetical protein P8I91_00490 [Phycisphaerales bacterium]|nr:hypothetical protein [Phycisphaerales bacterium]